MILRSTKTEYLFRACAFGAIFVWIYRVCGVLVVVLLWSISFEWGSVGFCFCRCRKAYRSDSEDTCFSHRKIQNKNWNTPEWLSVCSTCELFSLYWLILFRLWSPILFGCLFVSLPLLSNPNNLNWCQSVKQRQRGRKKRSWEKQSPAERFRVKAMKSDEKTKTDWIGLSIK